jgi:hypothetical protein
MKPTYITAGLCLLASFVPGFLGAATALAGTQRTTFTAIAASGAEAPWVATFTRGTDEDGPTYEGRVFRFEGAKPSKLVSWGPRVESERVIAMVPGKLKGKQGLLLVLEWMVEGRQDPRIAFTNGMEKTDPIELGSIENCFELQAVLPGKGADSLTFDCKPSQGKETRREVKLPEFSHSLSKPLVLPMTSARTPQGTTIQLRNPEKLEYSDPGAFAELIVRSSDGKITQSFDAKTLLGER